MSAESFSVFGVFIFCETGKQSFAFTFHAVWATGVGRTADPGGSVVLESPVAAKEMSAVCFLMATADEGDCQQKGKGNNGLGDDFWGE